MWDLHKLTQKNNTSVNPHEQFQHNFTWDPQITSCMRSNARILSSVSKDGESPPCKQKTYDATDLLSMTMNESDKHACMCDSNLALN